jgi:hypothetical protein
MVDVAYPLRQIIGEVLPSGWERVLKIDGMPQVCSAVFGMRREVSGVVGIQIPRVAVVGVSASALTASCVKPRDGEAQRSRPKQYMPSAGTATRCSAHTPIPSAPAALRSRDANDEIQIIGAITGTPPARIRAARTALATAPLSRIGSASGLLYMPIAW